MTAGVFAYLIDAPDEDWRSTAPTRAPADRNYAAEASAIRAELEREAPADDEEWTISTGALRALLEHARRDT